MRAAVWFSHPPHYEALAASMAAARRFLPADSKFVVVLDPAHPSPNSSEDIILRIPFDRGTHLNGPAAVAGVLDSMAAAARETGADDLLKIDSDMVLTSGGWMVPGVISLFRYRRQYAGLYACPSSALLSIATHYAATQPVSRHEANAIGAALSLAGYFSRIPTAEVPIAELTDLPCRFHGLATPLPCRGKVSTMPAIPGD